MIYGYARVSTSTQRIDRQVKNIERYAPEAKIYKEHFTGTKIDHPEWTRLLKHIQPGDTIVFDEVSRMSRNASEGFSLYKDLFEQNISLVFLKESHINTDSCRSAMSLAFPTVQTGDEATQELHSAFCRIGHLYDQCGCPHPGNGRYHFRPDQSIYREIHQQR